MKIRVREMDVLNLVLVKDDHQKKKESQTYCISKNIQFFNTKQANSTCQEHIYQGVFICAQEHIYQGIFIYAE